MSETERDYNNKLDLPFAGDNLPRLIEKIIVGMPIRFSGDDLRLLEITNECIQHEINRREKLGRRKKWNSMKEKNAFHNAKRKKSKQQT